ncbi:hypothetical protein Droror1_Dr00004192 [Drosera rotundifolia]
MAVESSFEAMLFQNLKLDEPWLEPRPWESIPSESGRVQATAIETSSDCRDSVYRPSSLSEESLVRLVMNALQGGQSALISIQKLSASFCAIPADRSALRVPSLWNRSLSTSALGEILKAIGYSGCLVFLLQRFVAYFIGLSYGGNANGDDCPSFSLVNHAFAISVGKVLDGYICGLNTLTAAACLRRSMGNADELSNDSSKLGCLTSIVHSELTVLEVYLHSKELRTRTEALGNLCNLCDVARCFSVTPIEDITTKAAVEFCNFPRGGYLITFLYDQLQVIDPVNSSLLKFLFLRSLEPYWEFVRSWIYEAKISDPHGEFIIKHDWTTPAYSDNKAGIQIGIPMAIVRVEDGISVPCFLENLISPMLRAGQQLQVVMKLLDVCKYVVAGDYALSDVLPGCVNPAGHEFSYTSLLNFNRRNVASVELSRKTFYGKMMEKLETVMKNFEKREQETFNDKALIYEDNFGRTAISYSLSALVGTLDLASGPDQTDSFEASPNADFETNSLSEDFGFDDIESSDCSSTDGCMEQCDSHQPTDRSELFYLSTLRFSSDVVNYQFQGDAPQSHEKYSISRRFLHTCKDEDLLSISRNPLAQATKDEMIDFERTVQPSKSWLPEIQYAGHEFHHGSLVRSWFENFSGSSRQVGAKTEHVPVIGQKREEAFLHSSAQYASNCFSHAEECYRNKFVGDSELSSNSYIFQSWNAKHQSDVLSMNPLLRKSPFCSSMRYGDQDSANFGEVFGSFDFSSVIDPFKLWKKKTAHDTVHLSEFQYPVASVAECGDGYQRRQANGDALLRGKIYSSPYDSCFDLNRGNIDVHPEVALGESASKILVPDSSRTTSQSIGHHSCNLQATFDMPLDFVIDKCLLQEILFQYNYVSRLTIELLEKGFYLQEHFLALRRYYLMEKADWADMFVMSLWHHNWFFCDMERRIADAQKLLESSIQRSSCDRDAYKNRLYVYNRSHLPIPVLNSSLGIHSFDFIGLGYRVDWPVSIILTSNALTIYAKIFSFLIQVKLAALSLTDIWYSLKDFRHMDSRSCDKHHIDWNHFNVLIKLRHQVNHFICILQQYVLSQLSDVSWRRFLHSSKQEVKDMMDLESVHLSYITSSLHVCFLTDEAQPISNIIASILQCALDFRSCLVKKSGNVGGDEINFTGNLSQINISQVVSIKEKFYKSMSELHLHHLKSPKHQELGLSRFWSYLNYNEYYSDLSDNTIPYFGIQG